MSRECKIKVLCFQLAFFNNCMKLCILEIKIDQKIPINWIL